MRTAWILAAALTASLGVGVGAAWAGPQEDELVAIEAAWTKASAARNFAALEAALAPDWRGQNDGGASTRAEMLAKSKADKERVSSAVNRDVHVRILGDVAVVQGFEDDVGKAAGKPFKRTYSWTDVFQKRDGRWLAIASQNTVQKK
ncbi:hypothetical protein BH09PSE2_BH09PSE2_00890 [soil metagenome]